MRHLTMQFRPTFWYWLLLVALMVPVSIQAETWQVAAGAQSEDKARTPSHSSQSDRYACPFLLDVRGSQSARRLLTARLASALRLWSRARPSM